VRLGDHSAGTTENGDAKRSRQTDFAGYHFLLTVDADKRALDFRTSGETIYVQVESNSAGGFEPSAVCRGGVWPKGR
jgi:hypothetical protein